MSFFKRHDELHLPPGHVGKLLSILRFMKLWQKDTYNVIVRLSELKPASHELQRRFVA